MAVIFSKKYIHIKLSIIFRHYLDFIQQMVKLYAEKRADLEEQQLHLNVGLGKIAETVEQVEEMQKSLAVKSQVNNKIFFIHSIIVQ